MCQVSTRTARAQSTVQVSGGSGIVRRPTIAGGLSAGGSIWVATIDQHRCLRANARIERSELSSTHAPTAIYRDSYC